jgi:hypothetical protein
MPMPQNNLATGCSRVWESGASSRRVGIDTAIIAQLGAGATDEVVEFAPGLGVTARMTLARGPKSYVGIERDHAVARQLQTDLGS